MRPRDLAAAGQSNRRFNRPLPAMMHDAEAAATNAADAQTPRPSRDLLGVAYLATIGVVMVAWIGGLIWAGVAVVSWLIF